MSEIRRSLLQIEQKWVFFWIYFIFISGCKDDIFSRHHEAFTMTSLKHLSGYYYIIILRKKATCNKPTHSNKSFL